MENIRLILILLLISFGVFGMVEEKKEKDNFLLRSNNKNNDNHHNQNNNPDNNTIYIINKYSNNNNKNNKNKNNISISHSNKFKRHIQCSNNNNILRGLKVLTVPTKPSTSSICYSNKETCCPTETEKQIQQHITTMINNTINKLVQPVYKAVEGTYDLWKAYISDLLSSTGETTERMIVNEFKIQSMHSSISQLIHQFNSSIHQSIHPSVHPFSPELSQTITTFADQLFLNAYFEFIHPGTHSASWNEELKKCILKFRLPNHQFLGTLAFKPSLSQLGLLSQSFHSSLRALIFSIHPSQCQTDLMKMAGCTTCAQQHTCINYCLRVTSNCFRPLLSLQPVWNNFVDAFIKYHQFVGEAPTLPFRLFPLRVFDGVVEFLINSRIIYNTVNTECANYSYPNIKPANLTQLEEKAQKLKEQKKSFFDNSLLALLEDDYNSNIADEDYRHNKVLNDYYNYNFDDNSDDNQDGDEEDEDAEYDNYDYDDEGYIDDDDDPYITDSNEDGVEIEDDMNYDDEDDVSNYPDDIMKHKKRRKRYAENKNNNNNNNSKNNINSNINMFMKSITSWVWLDVPPGVCHLFIPDSDLDNNNNNNIENRFLNRRKREATYHHRHFGPHDNGLGGGGVGSMRDSGKNKNDDKTDESHNILSMKNFLPLKPTYLKFLPSSSSPSSSSSFSSPSSLSSFYSYLDYYTEFDLNHYRPFFKDAEGCTDDSLFHSQGMHKSTEPSKELLDIASALHNLTHRMVFKFMSPYRPELESGFDNDDEEGDYGQGYEDGSGEYVDEDYIFDGSGDYIYDVEMYDYENETEAEETTTYNGHHHVLSDTPPTTTTSTKTKSSSSSSSSSILPIFFCIIFVMKMFDF